VHIYVFWHRKEVLKFVVFDTETKNSVQLLSRNTRITLSDDLLRFIQEHPDLQMSLS